MTLLRRFAEAEEAGRKLGVAGPPKSAAESRYCWERRCGATFAESAEVGAEVEASVSSVLALCSMARTTGSCFLAPSMAMLRGRARDRFLECERE